MRDRHHILHNRQEWTLRPQAERLRETPQLVPLIDREVHEEIHRECPVVPLLGYHALNRVNGVFRPVKFDTLKTIDNLLLSIDYAVDHPKAHPLERQLGQLVIATIETQRPFIADYFESQTRTVIDLANTA